MSLVLLQSFYLLGEFFAYEPNALTICYRVSLVRLKIVPARALCAYSLFPHEPCALKKFNILTMFVSAWAYNANILFLHEPTEPTALKKLILINLLKLIFNNEKVENS